MTNFVPYVTFMKHAKKVATARVGRTRPILSTVLHRDDYVAVTDSHRLYIVNHVYEGEEKTVDAKTGQIVEHGKYPDVLRLISDTKNAKFSHEIDVTKAYEAVRAIEIAGKAIGENMMKIEVIGSTIVFGTLDNSEIKVSYAIEEGKAEVAGEQAYFDTKFIKEALHVLKDAKAETFTLYYYGNVRPMQLVSGNFTAVIMPIRQSKEVPTGRVYQG